MEGECNRPMGFNIISNEVLALILRLTPSAVPELWKAGDRLLCQKLINGGVTELILTLIGRETHLPRCVAQFKGLRKMSLYCAQNSPSGLDADLKLLPKSLKHLELTGHVTGLFPIAPKAGRLFGHHLAVTPNYPKWELKDLDISAMIDWNEFWPNLESLCVVSNSLQKYASIVLGDFIFRFLPRSLLSLDISTFRGDGIFADFSDLPPNLSTLNLPPNIITVENLHRLPPRITRIDKGLNPSCLDKLLLEPVILPNLEEFPPLNRKQTAQLDSLAALPSSIRSMAPTANTANLIKRLPAQLTKFSCASPPSFILQSTDIMSLPRTLTSLVVGIVEWTPVEAHHWPPHLKRLELARNPGFGPDVYCRLPRSIKKLIVREDSSAKRALLALDAPITDLDLSLALANGKASLLSSHDCSLWTSIKGRLERYGENQGCIEAMKRYIDDVNDGALYGLPLTLTSLNIENIPSLEQIKLVLPPQLVKLHLSQVMVASNQNFWQLLPPSLTSLTLKSNTEIAKVEEWELISASDPTSTAIYNNKTLAFLELQFSGASILSKYLPRSISSLILIDYSRNCRLEDSLQLPQRLENLTFFSSKVQLNSVWIGALAPGLLHLSIESPIDGSVLHLLPPKLQTLTTQLINVKIEHVLSLPSGITSFYGNFQNLVGEGYLKPEDMNVLQTFVPFSRIKERTKEEIEQLIVDDEQLRPRMRWNHASSMWDTISIRDKIENSAPADQSASLPAQGLALSLGK